MKSLLNIEEHPLEPFLPVNAKLLMLGSFPPQKKRWSMEFFYPNLQNDMWRIFGIIFFQNKDHFLNPDKKVFDKERIIDLLNKKGIALYDTASAVRRLQDNASDKFLEVVEQTDISLLLKQIPMCKAIVTTGQKATDIIREQIKVKEPVVGTSEPFEKHGSSSVGRAPVSKTGCREFEPLLPCKKDYSMPRHWIIFFYIFYFLKEFAKVYEFVGSTATLDVAKCKQSLLLY